MSLLSLPWHGAPAALAYLHGQGSIPVMLAVLVVMTAAVVMATTGLCIYRLWFHPLARVPGPRLAACSSLWLAWHSFVGDECTAVFRLHEKYGPVLRVGPNDVDIADADAVNPIYVERGGFAKTANYSKFDVDGHATLFSSLTRDSRLARARAVAPLFSTSTIRKSSGLGESEEGEGGESGGGDNAVHMMVERFVECVKLHADHCRATGRPVNALLLGRSLALDAVSTHLFKQTYGALDEMAMMAMIDKDKSENASEMNGYKHGDRHENMSAALFVDAFVGVGAFFNLHAWFSGWDMKIMDIVDRFTGILVVSGTNDSIEKIDEYTARLVDTAVPGSGSYASRLLMAGTKARAKSGSGSNMDAEEKAWRRQVQAECKDVCFAGTDSSGMNLSMLLWQLSRHPDVYARLQKELAAHVETNGPAADITTNPYMRGVVRESLRLSWAAPTRLPRLVPADGKFGPTGWSFGGFLFPPGTSVGVASFQLHQDETVFPEPKVFKPERWLQPTERMLTSFFAFGKGGRACIGQNLALSELYLAATLLAQSNALRGASTVNDHIDILEWFNSRVIGEEILLTFS